jgi:hypothetical protein
MKQERKNEQDNIRNKPDMFYFNPKKDSSLQRNLTVKSCYNLFKWVYKEVQNFIQRGFGLIL